MGLDDRGIKPTKSDERGGSFLNKTRPIAILLEPFFLDDIKDREILNDYMRKTKNAILEILDSLEKNK